MDLKQFCIDNNISLEKLGDIGEVSDGFHTFNSLYHQRLILFATLVNAFPHLAWKSRKHSDGEVPFGGGWFIVGISTPSGQYTYHYEDKDWDIFHCREVETAPEWDGHTDKDVVRLLSLTAKSEEDTATIWAAKEVELAIQTEKESSEGTDEWEMGVKCYESALRVIRCLSYDDHDERSIQMTKSILNRLIDGRVLTPIEDKPDIWTDISEDFSKDNKHKYYQCNRMSSLFKDVAPDGTVTFSDSNRVQGVNVNNPYIPFTSVFLTQLIDAVVPITFPYLPSSKKFRVAVDEFRTNPKSKECDTVGYLYFTTPDGMKVELNRYFKEADGQLVQIEKAEFDERKAKLMGKK